jgi:hypothetical protein
MTEKGKKWLVSICIFVAIVALLASIYGLFFIHPKPDWAHDALFLGFIIFALVGILESRKKQRD